MDSTSSTIIFCFFVLTQALFTIHIGNDLSEKAWRIGELESQVTDC